MKTRKLADTMVKLAIIWVACIALGGSSGMLTPPANAQTSSNTQATRANLPPGVADVIGLTKAGFSEDSILAKVKKAGVSYDLTAEQMIYLKNQGVSENVISALLQAGPASTPPPPVSTPSVTPPPTPVTAPPVTPPAPAPASSEGPPEAGSGESSTATTAPPPGEPVVNADYVQEQLSPYGSWVDVPGYGRCWQPSELPTGWRPYSDGGHWVYTDAGLYWQSDYPWGAVAFHYGRWTWAGDYYHWIWVPGYEYAPAWVFWRHADGYVGWAPLPYSAVFVDGGWTFRSRRFAVDYDFGFGAPFFVFVGYDHLWERDYHRFILRGDEFHRIYGRSEISRLRRDEHGRFVHEGLDREHLERFTGRKVDVVRHEEVRNHEREALRNDHDRVMRNGGHAEVYGKPEEQRGKPEEQRAKPEEQRAKPEEQRAKPQEQRAKPEEQRGKPQEQRAKPEDKGKEGEKNPNQSKGNTNQRVAQLKGAAGS